MFKFYSALKKEFLILLRDKAGLMLLFLMPMVLIVVMSLLQEVGYSSVTRESRLKVLFLNLDQDSLGLKIEEGLRASNYFELVESFNSQPLNEMAVKNAVRNGDYIIGIIIPKGVTRCIRANVRIMVAKTLAGFGFYDQNLIGTLPMKDADTITIYFDPTVKKTFKNTIVSTIKEFNHKVEAEMVFRTFNIEMAKLFPNFAPPEVEYKEVVHFKEVFPTFKPVEEIPNSAQHNVPAWAVFAMFFIIIPFTNNIITERQEGSLFRLQCAPVSHSLLLLAKVAVYLVVCIFQTVLMILSGILILPLFGTPMLVLGTHYFTLFFFTVSVALAALGFGLMVGTMATTHQQASAFGAVSIPIMAALGGLFVPMYLMPGFMQHVAHLSPLNWGISGYYNIFIRGGGFVDILGEASKLLSFFLVTSLITYLYHLFKNPMNK